MAGLELVLILLAVSVALRVIAERLEMPYAVLLVVGGLALALIPGMPQVHLPPDALFLVFVPPLLYSGARAFPLRDFRRERGPIVRLAIVMVLVSMVAVAAFTHAVDPTFTWAAAFTLGAIVSPPDPVAVVSIMRTLRAPRGIIDILEGEGLFDDATALIAYRMAVAAAVTGVFSPWNAAERFFLGAAAGILIGVGVGKLVVWAHKLTRSVAVAENTVSLLTPFIAYLPADFLGASGVLAVVAAGMYMARAAPRTVGPETRVQNDAMWTVVTFVLESLIFILVGLQLPAVLHAVERFALGPLFREALLITACVIVVRMVWVFPSSYIGRRVGGWLRGTHEEMPSWQWIVFVGWAGVRGGDSIVIALALPLTVASGAPFPARDRIIFITFVVIFVTLVLQGPTLAPFMRLLHLGRDVREEEQEEAHARLTAVEAGLRKLEDPAFKSSPYPEIIRYLGRRHRQRARRWAVREAKQLEGQPHDHEHSVAAPSHDAGVLDENRAGEYRRVRSEMIRAEQDALIDLRDRDIIGDDVMRRILRDLDLESILLDTREPVVEPASEVSSSLEAEP